MMKGDFFADGYLRFQEGHWVDEYGDPVDAVEVTRCKDCEHCIDATRNQETVRCAKYSTFMQPTDFCSYGR